MYKNKQQFLGFTLIEMLVVVAIIGMLSSTIIAGVGRARMKARDSKRLSDMDQIRKGMDLYYSQGSGYPNATAWNTGNIVCSGNQILKVPHDPGGLADYQYVVDTTGGGIIGPCGDDVYPNFYVVFRTEQDSNIGSPPGPYYLTPQGVKTTAPF